MAVTRAVDPGDRPGFVSGLVVTFLGAGLLMFLLATVATDSSDIWWIRDGPRYVGSLLVLVGLLVWQAAWMKAKALQQPARRDS